MLWKGAELLLIIFHLHLAQSSEHPPPITNSELFPGVVYTPGPSYLSLILLAFTVGLSGSIYLCVLRYICAGCCQPVVVGPETETLSGVV
ncbi:rab32-Rab38 domain-containing protein [Astyanax mexicanus]|uniref:Rab32-Rab38 domain-containing protein n=1 Tax=Astyanax mexicanus TaxID=7994 RepID=A0A8T2LSR4_ASTMX|nr:rab32-Rab38 domain-containing protein [Astyanax mexicanus]